VEKAIHDGKTPGAVILVGNSDGAYYQRAFGYRSLEPENILNDRRYYLRFGIFDEGGRYDHCGNAACRKERNSASMRRYRDTGIALNKER